MAEQITIAELMARVRSGDEAAAAEIVQRYEPQIRRIIRVRLTDPGLRRQMDSIDICQSVMADFFVRVALGQYELDTPESLVKLLATMARNKLINHAEKQRAGKRDIRRLEKVDAGEVQLAGAVATPRRIVAGRELLQAFQERLTEKERYLADQRALGRTWAEIAPELNQTPDAVRMQLTRGLGRVAKELGLETGDIT